MTTKPRTYVASITVTERPTGVSQTFDTEPCELWDLPIVVKNMLRMIEEDPYPFCQGEEDEW
jgi:hypothetical protein